METLFQQLQRHEGLRLKQYQDTTGHKTIGYGHNIHSKGMPVGMNPFEITRNQALVLLRQDLDLREEISSAELRKRLAPEAP